MTVDPPRDAIDDATPQEGRRRIRLSLSRTLTLGLSLLILASLGTSLGFAISAAQKNTMELERDLSELLVQAAIREVETHLGAAQNQVEFLSAHIERGEVDINDDRHLTAVMQGALAAAPQVSGIALVRSDYSVLRAGQTAEGLFSLTGNWADRADIREVMNNPGALHDDSWRAIVWIEDFEAPHVVVGEPLFRGGKFLGVVFSVASLGALSSFLAEFDAANQTRSFILYGRDSILAHSSLAGSFSGLSEDKPLPSLAEVKDPALQAIWNEVIDDMAYMLEGSTILGHVVRGADEDYIYLYRELDIYGQRPWIVGVYFLSSEVNLPFKRLVFAGVAGLVILVLAIAVGLLLARSIVQPLQRLASASQSVQRLELSRVEPLRGSLFNELDVAVKAFDSMLAGLRWFETYVPRNLVLRLMRSGGTSVQSEEREVTVLFTDLVGFTRIAALLSPAELADLLNAHFTLLAEAIEAEEGTVDKYIGDSIMAFWGAPTDQSDHAARACRAARDIARRVSAENARRRAAGEAPLGLRVGIHSGSAIVGNIGAPGRINYTMIGDTVNIAQRLEGLGKEVAPDSEVAVLLSVETRTALDSNFGVEDLGAFVLRGREAPLQVYRLDLTDGGS